MIRLDIKHQDGHEEARFGSERELYDYLKSEYPILNDALNLEEAVGMQNDTELFVVKTSPVKARREDNVLPDDYLTATQRDDDDPWPRAGDKTLI